MKKTAIVLTMCVLAGLLLVLAGCTAQTQALEETADNTELSTTKQMPELAARELDYAFFCCDGRFNMDLEEAAECAKLVKAKHNLPYHMAPGAENNFDREIAEQFQAENRIIIEPGEDLLVV